MGTKIQGLMGLVKFKITSAVVVTATAGYILAQGRLESLVFLPMLGLLFVAFGSAALNHLQEHDLDGQMERTRHRPLSSGALKPWQVLLIAAALVVSGSALLYFFGGEAPFVLGLLALFWYNGIYTPLKRRTAWAIIPGGLIGSLPPLIGWSISGLPLWDVKILAFCFFMFIWQVPHFWLLSIRYSQDYAKAGFPMVTSRFSEAQLSRIIYSWILSTAVAALLMPLYGGVNYQLTAVLLIAAGIWVVALERQLLGVSRANVDYRLAFNRLNIYALMVVMLISLDELLFAFPGA
jgi:heme o synthase